MSFINRACFCVCFLLSTLMVIFCRFISLNKSFSKKVIDIPNLSTSESKLRLVVMTRRENYNYSVVRKFQIFSSDRSDLFRYSSE